MVNGYKQALEHCRNKSSKPSLVESTEMDLLEGQLSFCTGIDISIPTRKYIAGRSQNNSKSQTLRQAS